MNKLSSSLVLSLAAAVLTAGPVLAEDEPAAEVLSLEGNAYCTKDTGFRRGLAEGDLIRAGDYLELTDGAQAQIGFDKDWKNAMTVEGGTKVLVASIYPMSLKMTEGGVFAKLDQLPEGSSFEVRTPVLVASVRGSEYQVTYREGEAEVINYSDSTVYVYARDEAGRVRETPVTLAKSQVTSLAYRGAELETPQTISAMESEKGMKMRSALENKAKDAVSQGRVGRLRDIGSIRGSWKQNLGRPPKDSEAVRQVDAPTPKKPGHVEQAPGQEQAAPKKRAGPRKPPPPPR